MAEFKGFSSEDFGTLEGSTWRGRDALGGVLSRALRPQVGADCQSWGVRRRLELHIARKSLYNFETPLGFAKLFVYTHEEELAYGFYVESSGKRTEDGKYRHWKNFRDRILAPSPLRDAIHEATDRFDLILTDYYREHRGDDDRPVGRFEIKKSRFKSGLDPTSRPLDSLLPELAHAAASATGDMWIDFHIYASMSRNEAIRKGWRVVDAMLPVLDALAPVYLETIA
jgi:hypothetical protein